jgi:hypothetical protein
VSGVTGLGCVPHSPSGLSAHAAQAHPTRRCSPPAGSGPLRGAARVLEFFETATALTAAYLSHGVELGYLRADHQRQLNQAVRRLMYDGIAAR